MREDSSAICTNKEHPGSKHFYYEIEKQNVNLIGQNFSGEVVVVDLFPIICLGSIPWIIIHPGMDISFCNEKNR